MRDMDIEKEREGDMREGDRREGERTVEEAEAERGGGGERGRR